MGEDLKAIGILGGTFDPVHSGHIKMAQAAKSILNLDEVRLVPCHLPPHRDTPRQTSVQRLKLLKLAIESVDGLVADDREMKRAKPSWTVDTLKDFRDEFGNDVSLSLLMGADSFGQLTDWHQWQELPKLAHIAVFLRPGYTITYEGVLGEWLDKSLDRKLSLKQLIRERSAGHVLVLNQSQINISATDIRKQLASGIMPKRLDSKVQHYIKQHQLYGYVEK